MVLVISQHESLGAVEHKTAIIYKGPGDLTNQLGTSRTPNLFAIGPNLAKRRYACLNYSFMLGSAQGVVWPY